VAAAAAATVKIWYLLTDILFQGSQAPGSWAVLAVFSDHLCFMSGDWSGFSAQET
jgi:hypothetical protein